MDPRARPERRRVPGARRRSTLAAALLLAPLAGLPACLCPPTLADIESTGFRSPAQTLRTFQTAVRADDPALEYRCLSVGFRERNGVSQLAWREFRDKWFASNPFVKRGIATAETVSEELVTPSRARIVAESSGHRMVIELAREGFYQLYSGAELAADGLLPDQRGLDPYLLVEPSGDDRLLVHGAFDVRASELPPEPTELRVGLEWKIDDIYVDPDTATETDEANP